MNSNKTNSNQKNWNLIWYEKKTKKDEIAKKKIIYKMISNKTIAIKRMGTKFEDKKNKRGWNWIKYIIL
jgi:hypothetical protein